MKKIITICLVVVVGLVFVGIAVGIVGGCERKKQGASTEADVYRLVEQRKRDATAKKLHQKAFEVSIRLGKFLRNEPNQPIRFTSGKLVVDYRGSNPENPEECITVSVKYDGKEVFHDYIKLSGRALEISVYIPGEWEKELDELYSKVKKIVDEEERKREEEERKKKEEEKEKLIKDFGLEGRT